MESLGKFPDPFFEGIVGQPAAIRRAAEGLGEQRGTLEAVARLARREGLIVWSGMGASYHACYPAVTLLAARGIPSLHVDAAELLHFHLPTLLGASLLVLVSQSGESAEVVRLATSVAPWTERPLLLAVTNLGRNRLAQIADLHLDTMAGWEEGPSTMTFVSSLVVLAALAEILRGRDTRSAIPHIQRCARTAADAVERLVRDPAPTVDRLVGLLASPSITLLGRGPGLAAAATGALTLKESGVPAEAMGTGQYRHGPLELGGPGSGIVILATEPETQDLDLRLAERLVGLGATVVVISPDGRAPVGAVAIAVGQLERGFAPAATIVPIQLLAWHAAGLRGRQPGEYLRASKVTTDE